MTQQNVLKDQFSEYENQVPVKDFIQHSLASRIISKRKMQQLRSLYSDCEVIRNRYEQAHLERLDNLENQCQQAIANARQQSLNKAAEDLLGVTVEIERAYKEQQSELIKLMFAALESLLGEFANHQITTAMVRSALDQQTDHQSVISVVVHPEVYDNVRTQLVEWQETNQTHRIELKSDSSKALDDCEIETHFGTIEAGLQGQLAALKKTLLNACESKVS